VYPTPPTPTGAGLQPPAGGSAFPRATGDSGYQPPTGGPGYQPPTGGPGYQPPTGGPGYQPPTGGPGYPPDTAYASPTEGGSYGVHLESLRSFAAELQAQIDVISRSTTKLTSPAATGVALGDFPEAAALGERHAAALSEMVALLERVRAAISFAERVTETVASSYTAADDASAHALGRLAV
jgi:hypothetical protein